jgi:hypothetical protein
MRRRVAVAIASILLAMASGCGREHSFVIVNRSAAPLVVEYRFAPLPSGPNTANPNYAVRTPETKEEQGLFEWEARWKAFPSDRAAVDRERGTVRVELEPQESLRVAHLFEYAGKPTWDAQARIAALTLDGASGRVELEGDEVHASFVETGGAYVLEFR